MPTRVTKTERTYGQWCPVAAGLDILGDRWVLLICRELLISDSRFTDLRAALPGLAPNLLTERLRSLQSLGLVETVDLPAPAARTVYRLTEEGHGVTPVLRAMARFGVLHLDGDSPATFDARRALHSLVLPWRKRIEADLRIRLVLAPGTDHDDEHDDEHDNQDDTRADLVLKGTGSRVAAAQGTADVTITTTAAALARSRQRAGLGLKAQVSGSAAAKRLALDALGLHLDRRGVGTRERRQ